MLCACLNSFFKCKKIRKYNSNRLYAYAQWKEVRLIGVREQERQRNKWIWTHRLQGKCVQQWCICWFGFFVLLCCVFLLCVGIVVLISYTKTEHNKQYNQNEIHAQCIHAYTPAHARHTEDREKKAFPPLCFDSFSMCSRCCRQY